MKRKVLYILSLLLILFSSCTNEHLQEAKNTVAQADSIMAIARAEGWYSAASGDTTCILGDSIRLAEATNSLSKPLWRPFFHARDYAHASYHYARLLREHDDFPAAMQAFINITHSTTNDHIIKGRAYSNIATLCNLESNYALAYDFYQKAATEFICAKDTLAYYYAINDKVFQLTEQRQSEAIDSIFHLISSCSDSTINRKFTETLANAYMMTQCYDSAIYYANTLRNNGDPTPIMILAQSYSYLNIKDSATYYAQLLLQMPHSLFNLNNALYILTNDDETKNAQDIKGTAALRADVQKQIEIQQGRLSHAVEILLQDLHHTAPLKRFIILTCIIILLLTIAILNLRYLHFRKVALDNEVELTHEMCEQAIERMESYCVVLNNPKDIYSVLHWKDYQAMCQLIDAQFNGLSSKLIQKYALNELEIRVCILTMLQYTQKDIAMILPYAETGVGKLKYRVAKKIGISARELREFLLHFAIQKV